MRSYVRCFLAALFAALLGMCFLPIAAHADEAVVTGETPLLQDGDFPEQQAAQPKLRGTSSSGDTASVFSALLQASNSWDGSRHIAVSDLFAYQVPYQQMKSVMPQFFNSHPELFFLTGAYSLSYNTETGYLTAVQLSASPKYTPENVAQFNEALSTVCSMADPSWTDERKALFIHDYLATHCDYDLSYSGYDAYSCLVGHAAVCQGYSLAFQALANELGLPCDIISSDMLNHAWNYVSVDGVGYYIDVVWDDPIVSSTVPTYHSAFVRHRNFLRSRDGILTTGHSASGETPETNTATDWLNSRGEAIYDVYAVGSDAYEGHFWAESNSVIVDLGDKYVYRAGATSTQLRAYDKATGEDRLWASVPEMNTYYDSIARFGDRVAIATPTTIYLTYPKGAPYDAVFTNQSEYGIYGIVENPDGLWYSLMDSPGGTVFDTRKLDAPFECEPTAISLGGRSKVSLREGTLMLHASVSPYDAVSGGYIWTSSDESVASFADPSSGLLTLNGPGTVTVTVACVSYPLLSASLTIEVDPRKSLADAECEVSGIEASYPYTRSPIKPVPTVTWGGELLTVGTDYELSYSKNLNAGSAYCKIVGIGDYCDSVERQFAISRVQTYSLGATYNGLGMPVYDGTPKHEIYYVLVHNGEKLVEGVDFTASYSENIAAGTGKIYFTGMGNYYGTAGVSFTISPLSLSTSGLTFELEPSECTYSGTPCEPALVKMVYNGVEVPIGNVSVSYESNVAAGSGKMIISPATANVSSSKTLLFPIAPADMSLAAVNVGMPASFGGEPVVEASFNGQALEEGRDYTLEYDGSNAILSGTGNFAGQVSYPYSQPGKNEQHPVRPESISVQYRGLASFEISDIAEQAEVTYRIADTSIARIEGGAIRGRSVGSTLLMVWLAETESYAAKAFSIPVTVNARDISSATFSGTDDEPVLSDGAYFLPNLAVEDEGRQLEEGSDYTVAYSDNTAPGSSATATVTGTGNYCGSVPVQFQVPKQQLILPIPKSLQMTYGDTFMLALGSVEMVPDMAFSSSAPSVAFVDEDGLLTAVGVGTALIDIDIAETASYEAAHATVSVSVSPASLAGARISDIAPQIATGNPIEPAFTVSCAGKQLVRGTDFTAGFSDNVSVGLATLSISGVGNYTGEAYTTFSITAPHVHSHEVAFTWNGTSATYTATCACGDVQSGACRVDAALVSKATFAAAGQMSYTAYATVDGTVHSNVKLVTIKRVAAPAAIAKQNWTGKVIKPAVTLKDTSGAPIPKSSYSLTYSNNVKPGTASIKITLSGNYAGTKTVTFAIAHATHAYNTSFTWNGVTSATYKATCPCGHSVSGTAKITKATTKATPSAAGKLRYTASATVGGKTVSSVKNVVIPKIASATLAYTSAKYTGKALKPAVKVKLSTGSILAAANYTVAYKSNTNVGTASVTITFKNNYSGKLTRTFKILPKPTTLASLTSASKAFTAKWGKQATQTTGYQLMYSTNSKFSSGNKTATIASNSTVTRKVTGLTASKKYYVKIRTYKTVGSTKYYSAWSAVKTVTAGK